MNTEEKREYLFEKVMSELEKAPIEIIISSPRLKSARKPACYKQAAPPPLPKNDAPVSERPEALPSHHVNESGEIYKEEEPAIDEKRLARKQRKEQKEAVKQQKKYEKAYKKMQKDIVKRGFDTAVLTRLNDPADIYHMSDDEIREIEIAGVINSDGYYNFVYPQDYDSAKKQKTSRRTFFIIAGFILAVAVLLVVLINNIFSLF